MFFICSLFNELLSLNILIINPVLCWPNRSSGSWNLDVYSIAFQPSSKGHSFSQHLEDVILALIKASTDGKVKLGHVSSRPKRTPPAICPMVLKVLSESYPDWAPTWRFLYPGTLWLGGRGNRSKCDPTPVRPMSPLA